MNEEHTSEEIRPEAGAGERPEEEKEVKEIVFCFRLPRMPKLLPKEARDHLRAAQRELLLAMRSVVDECIRCLEKSPEEQSRRVTRIEIR